MGKRGYLKPALVVESPVLRAGDSTLSEILVLVEVLCLVGERLLAGPGPLSGESLFGSPDLFEGMGGRGGRGGEEGALGPEPVLVSDVVHHHVIPFGADEGVGALHRV